MPGCPRRRDGHLKALTDPPGRVTVNVARPALVALLVALAALGVLARDDHGARFPAWSAAVATTALLAVTAAVVSDQFLWLAVGWTGLVTAATLVGAGATLPPRSAGGLGAAVTALPLLVVLPLTGASVLLLAPAVLPLLLVGLGVAARALGTTIRS